MKNKESSSAPFIICIRSALIACALGVALAALFAFILQTQLLDLSAAAYVNTAIKVVCSAVAALLSVKKNAGKNLLRGALSGALFMILSTIVFSLIAGGFEFSRGLLTDLCVCTLSGAIVGIIRNLRG